jgi:hypothetical protein
VVDWFGEAALCRCGERTASSSCQLVITVDEEWKFLSSNLCRVRDGRVFSTALHEAQPLERGLRDRATDAMVFPEKILDGLM